MLDRHCVLYGELEAGRNHGVCEAWGVHDKRVGHDFEGAARLHAVGLLETDDGATARKHWTILRWVCTTIMFECRKCGL